MEMLGIILARAAQAIVIIGLLGLFLGILIQDTITIYKSIKNGK